MMSLPVIGSSTACACVFRLLMLQHLIPSLRACLSLDYDVYASTCHELLVD